MTVKFSDNFGGFATLDSGDFGKKNSLFISISIA